MNKIVEALIYRIKKSHADKHISNNVAQLTFTQGMILVEEIERLQALLDEVNLEFTDVHEED